MTSASSGRVRTTALVSGITRLTKCSAVPLTWGMAICGGLTSGGTSAATQPGSSVFFEWFIKPFFGRTSIADQRRQEQIVMRSPLRWTIARPGRLVNAAATGSYRVEPGYVVRGEHATVRADLADFLVSALADAHWEHQAEIAAVGR